MRGLLGGRAQRKVRRRTDDAHFGAVAEPRGISMIRDTSRDEAVAVLRNYAESDGITYNARQGDQTGGNDGTLA